MAKNNWYNKKARQSQSAIYNLLVEIKKIDEALLKSFVDKFIEKYLEKPNNGTTLSTKYIFFKITSNEGFPKFLSIVSEMTGVKFKKNSFNKKDTYTHWFQMSQLDGTFAYSGVTDDF